MIYNIGSINADFLYHVSHIPTRGETLSARKVERGLGGKGVNQSVAMINAGSDVCHLGAVGEDGQWLIEKLKGLGVDTSDIIQLLGPSGHAIITIGEDGENAITIFRGSNHLISAVQVQTWLAPISSSDYLVLQNETSQQCIAAKLAKSRGSHVVYSAAPFDVVVVAEILPFVDTLCVNEVEAAELMRHFKVKNLMELGVSSVLTTLGPRGATYQDFKKGIEIGVDGISVKAVDTTGAGDTFCGYFVALLYQGKDPFQALSFANAAAALKVTKLGAAAAIPNLAEVVEFKSKLKNPTKY